MQTLFGDDLVLGKQNRFGECVHEHKSFVTGQFGPHFAKELCKDCGKFLRWMKNPNFAEKIMQVDGLVKTIPNTFAGVIDIDEMGEPPDYTPNALMTRFAPVLEKSPIPREYFWACMRNRQTKRIALSMCLGSPTKIYPFKGQDFTLLTMFEVATPKFGAVIIYFYETE